SGTPCSTSSSLIGVALRLAQGVQASTKRDGVRQSARRARTANRRLRSASGGDIGGLANRSAGSLVRPGKQFRLAQLLELVEVELAAHLALQQVQPLLQLAQA